MLNIAVAGDHGGGRQAARAAAAGRAKSKEVGGTSRSHSVDGEHDYSELATALVEAGHKLTLFREEEIDLETAFMALTKGITS